MKRTILTLVLVLVSLFMLGATAVPAASADICSAGTDPLDCACTTTTHGSGGRGTSALCSGTDQPIYGSGSVLQKATYVLSIIGGVAAVIVIIVAGIMFVTANGNAQQATNARNAVIGAIVGLVLIAAAVSIVTFVVNKAA